MADATLSNAPEVAVALGLGEAAISSTLLAALAYRQWGEGVVDRLEGAWSLAAVAPDGGLTLISDHLGLRPLFYVHKGGQTAFSSDPDALRRLPGVSSALDAAGFAGAWLEDIGLDDPQATALRDIKAVPPACILHLPPAGNARRRIYWRLEGAPELRVADELDAVAQFRSVFASAVASQLRECRTPALMLSGGIDSGAVLAAARGFCNGGHAPLATVSGLTEHELHGLPDEMRNLRRLLATHPQHIVFQLPPAHRDDVPGPADAAEVAWGYPHPLHGSALMHGLAFQQARRLGIDAVLDGIDGDLVMAPHADPIAAHLRGGRLGAAWRETMATARNHTYKRRSGARAIGLRAAIQTVTPGWVSAWRRVGNVGRDVMSAPLSLRVAASARLEERIAEIRRSLPRDRQERHCMLLAHRLSRSLGGTRLIANRWGIDSRHPWADRRVVEFFARLPLEWRVRKGWTKYIVRRACEDALGSDVVWHSGKSHVGMALTGEVVRDAAPYLRGVVESQYEALTELIKASLVDEALAHLRNPDAGGNCDNAMFVASLAGWLSRLGGKDGLFGNDGAWGHA